ncbi:MAG: hypothetical protein ACO1OB_12975 [Archangium sp.]
MIAQAKTSPEFITCPRCDYTGEAAGLSLAGSTVVAQCGSCRHHFDVAARRPSRPALRLVTPLTLPSVNAMTPGANPFSPPGTCCPKCAAQKRSLLNCVACGADFGKLEVMSLQPPRWLREMWGMVWMNWNDITAHESMLTEAIKRDALPALARLYRVRLAWSPLEPMATACLKEVSRRAALPLLQQLPVDTAPRRRRAFMWSGLTMGSMLVMLLLSVLESM